MSAVDTATIRARYETALGAKPSKGDYTQRGIDALTDSVCDIPTLLACLDHLDGLADKWDLIATNLDPHAGGNPDSPIGHAAAQMRQRATELREALRGAP